MAIRLRIINGEWWAFCAAKTLEEPGDIYLHDGWHYAISQKYWHDYDEIEIVDEEYEAIRERVECHEN